MKKKSADDVIVYFMYVALTIAGIVSIAILMEGCSHRVVKPTPKLWTYYKGALCDKDWVCEGWPEVTVCMGNDEFASWLKYMKSLETH